MRASTFVALREEADMALRVRKIVEEEDLTLIRLADAMGFPTACQLSAVLRNSVPAGPLGRERIRNWLAKWDAAEVDIESLKAPPRERSDFPEKVRQKYLRARKDYGFTHAEISRQLGLKCRRTVCAWAACKPRNGRGNRIGMEKLKELDRILDAMDLGRGLR